MLQTLNSRLSPNPVGHLPPSRGSRKHEERLSNRYWPRTVSISFERGCLRHVVCAREVVRLRPQLLHTNASLGNEKAYSKCLPSYPELGEPTDKCLRAGKTTRKGAKRGKPRTQLHTNTSEASRKHPLPGPSRIYVDSKKQN